MPDVKNPRCRAPQPESPSIATASHTLGRSKSSALPRRKLSIILTITGQLQYLVRISHMSVGCIDGGLRRLHVFFSLRSWRRPQDLRFNAILGAPLCITKPIFVCEKKPKNIMGYRA